MDAKIIELCGQAIEAASRLSGSAFEVQDIGGEMYFEYYRYNKVTQTGYYISQNGDKYWSQLCKMTVENLEYLVKTLKAEERRTYTK